MPRLAAAMVLALISPITPPASGDEPKPPGVLRVATFNIHHAVGEDGRLDVDRVAGVVAGSDLAAFQEVDVRFGARSRNEDQVGGLARALGGRAAFGGNLRAPSGDGWYGVALVTRRPILAERNHPLPRSPGREGAEPRGLLEVTVDVDGRPLRVFVTHLAHDSKPDRLLQVDAIRRALASGTGPAILLGDFNFRPDSEEYARLLAPTTPGGPTPLVDAWARVGRGEGPTIGLKGDHPGRIDYLFATPDLAPGVESIRVDAETAASDHQPLLATLRFPAEPPVR